MQRSIIAPAERVTNLRWAMAALMGLGILITACDQAGLAVNLPAIQREFGLDDVALGYLLSAFAWPFALAQIPFGLVLDRIGVQRTGRVWSAAWAIVSLVSAFASATFGLLLGTRALLGLAQAPALPSASKATGYWFPLSERSTGTAYFDASQKLALAIGIPLAAWLGVTYGWRSMFVVTGIAGIVYAIAFYAFYRDPAENPRLTHAERQHLATGHAQSEGPPSSVNIFAQRNVWGITIGFFTYTFTLFMFVTWLPDYVARTFHRSVVETASMTAIPWLIAFVADIVVGGIFLDFALKRAMDAPLTRKSLLVNGMIFAFLAFEATAQHNPAFAFFWITVAIAGLGISGPIVWSLPSLIAPRGRVGAVAGMMNFGGALGAIAAPIAAGYIVHATKSFDLVFGATAVALLVGMFSYFFVVGKIEPISEGPPEGILI